MNASEPVFAPEAAPAAIAAELEQLRSARPDRGMRADARRNYERLMAAAAAAFAERGGDDVSLEEIARRAGVGIGTLYRHFPTRPALLEAVYRDQVEGLGVLAVKLLTSESPGAALGEWMRALVDFGLTKRSLTRELLADAPAIPMCKSVLNTSSAALLERARKAGIVRTDVTAADLMRLSHGLVAAVDYGTSDPGLLDRMMSVLLAGLLLGPA